MSEEQTKYVADALEMMGTGYDQPTIVIEPPRTVTARQNGRMVEIEEPAWVKFSTDFKGELKTLDEYSLKVFLYIGLSVNWRTGTAFPGIRKIAEDTGMDKGTVAKATANLENLGFLTIQKRDGNSNVYRPVRYISIGTVRPERTPLSDESGELSDESGELSDKTPELSDASSVKLHNKKNKKENKNKLDIVDGILDYHIHPRAIQDAIKKHFKLTPNWEAKYNIQFMEWVVETGITPEEIEQAAQLWRTDKRFNWSVPTLRGIQEHWLQLISPPEVDKSKAFDVIQSWLSKQEAQSVQSN